ncbi:MAG: hypothetical protein JXL97_07315 [Bacteroidales bacterium]|nr:hypothetical protein [Bacteroidales bacterium]
MTENQNIRQNVKLYLKNRDYKKAIEYLDTHAETENVKNKISTNLSEYKTLEQKLNKSQIDNKSFFYGVNKVVMDILDIIDEITGEPENDWDFIDELNSTLKFNLVDAPENGMKQQQDLHENSNNFDKIHLKKEDIKDQEISLKDTIRKLINQLHKYEEMEISATDAEERKRYHDIIDGINSQILSYSKKLKELIPEEKTNVK